MSEVTMEAKDLKGNESDNKYHNLFPWINGENAEYRIVLNPDIDKVIEVVTKIKENHGYCPSQPVRERAKDEKELPFNLGLMPDMRCPCPDMTCKGECKCGLFVNTTLVSETKYVSDYNNIFMQNNKDSKEDK